MISYILTDTTIKMKLNLNRLVYENCCNIDFINHFSSFMDFPEIKDLIPVIITALKHEYE